MVDVFFHDRVQILHHCTVYSVHYRNIKLKQIFKLKLFLFLLFKRKKESLKVKFILISETRFSKVEMQFIKIEVLKSWSAPLREYFQIKILERPYHGSYLCSL